jgi:DNA repair protein RecO (recombination protein O)
MVQKVDNLERDEAFLLRSTDYGDYHRILSCLSARHGRLDLMAYSARSSKRRFSGVIDYLNCLKIEFKPHPRGGLAQLVNCELMEGFEKIRQDYQRSIIALRWMRLLSQVLQHGGHIPGLFSCLRECLESLQEKNEDWVDLVFRQRVLTRLGYHLEFTQCARCGLVEAEGFNFLPHDGGLLCSTCAPGRTGLKVEKPFAAYLWILQQEENPWGQASIPLARRLLDEGFSELLGFAS